MRILLTGATGFVGRALLQSLSKLSVRVAVRSRDSHIDPMLSAASDVVVVGEINADTQWQAALAGIDCVVHLAARVHIMNPGPEDARLFHETNALGTECLARAAIQRGVKKFIYLSSVKVNGEATFGTPYSAADLPDPQDDYG